MSNRYSLTLSVTKCVRCGGDHESVRFEPLLEGKALQFQAVCPVTGWDFVMDADPETYRRLLAAAGVK